MVEREIIRRVEAHTGRKTGTWDVSVSFHAAPQRKRGASDQAQSHPPIEIVSLSSQPKKIYLLAGNLIVETEPAFVPMMRKISIYAPKVSRSVRGATYDFVDFAVSVGMSFDKHGSATGVVVEIEYRPCPITTECEKLIGELMEKIAAPLVPPPPPPHATQDREVSAAATTAYNYTRVEVDSAKVSAKDLVPFSNVTSALLYAKLLRT